jgi:hypothetical protein
LPLALTAHQAFGERGFDYIGGGSTDEAVWRLSRCAYIANALPADLATLRTSAPHAQALGMRASLWRDYVLALRPHQWLKNILVFAPVLAAHHLGNHLLGSDASVELAGPVEADRLCKSDGLKGGQVRLVLDKRVGMP